MSIIIVGNTGVGKSYICNRIFKLCGSTATFLSNGSNYSVTQTLQSESVTFNGRNFKIVDCPGFFDVRPDTPNTERKIDAKNLCLLVKALKSYDEIYALVFVYTDRFLKPHKIWFQRMCNLLTEANRGHIILIHNKQAEYDVETYVDNKNHIRELLGGLHTQEYVWFSFNTGDDQVQTLLYKISNFTSFRLVNFVIPEICYEKVEEGKQYEVEVARTTNDEGELVEQIIDTSYDVEEVVSEGHYVEEIVDTSHYETRIEWKRKHLSCLFVTWWSVSKEENQVWVPSQTVEKKWIPTEIIKKRVNQESVEKIWVNKNVTRITIKTYINIYNCFN